MVKKIESYQCCICGGFFEGHAPVKLTISKWDGEARYSRWVATRHDEMCEDCFKKYCGFSYRNGVKIGRFNKGDLEAYQGGRIGEHKVKTKGPYRGEVVRRK